jgi:hypothetical protein
MEFEVRGCAPLHALQLLPRSLHVVRNASNGSHGVADHVCSIDEIVGLLDLGISREVAA